MAPIKGLSDRRRMPRLGKVRTGIKEKTDKGTEYPKAVDYFVVEPVVQEVYGLKPKALDIMFPVNDVEQVAPAWYKAYSRTRGLVCKGDGERADRLADLTTKRADENGEIVADIADRNTKTEDIGRLEMVCAGERCPYFTGEGAPKLCKPMMSLQFMIPRVEGFGVWQLDTSSKNSIIDIQSELDLLQSITGGRIGGIPLTLTLEPREVTADGKRKNVHTLHVRMKGTMAEALAASAKPMSVLLAPPAEDDVPELLYPDLPDEESGPAFDDGDDVAAPAAEVLPPAPEPTQTRPGLSLGEKRKAFRKAVEPLGFKSDEALGIGLRALGYESVEAIPEDQLRAVLNALKNSGRAPTGETEPLFPDASPRPGQEG